MPAPTVKIFFSGLLLLEPDEAGSVCDVGVHRSSPAHTFSIEVREKHQDTNIPDIVKMRHVGPVEFGSVTSPTTGEPIGILIDVASETSAGVRKFCPTDVFNRTGQDTDPRDLRWAIDFASDEFHGHRLDTDAFGLKPGIQITDAVFYTALRTDEAKTSVTRIGGVSLPDPADFHRIAAIIGANIYLSEGSKVTLDWRENGEPQHLELPKPDVSGIYYEIYIINDPPYTDEQKPATHDEFKEYYKVIQDVPTGEQFDLIIEPRGPASPQPPSLGTPTIPCMSGMNGG
jgi:hypothetical protein